ncbi:appetite-regulating hormone [Amia ocellicauda]|uniref:appetite-regulating hormone n=1 Tax=Amia ocellicauda TaxID=2972642 RepID=UPI0034649B3E
MLLKSSVCGLLLICMLLLVTENAQAGSSFLSPTQKPQAKPIRKPIPRVTRRDSEGFVDILEDLYGEENKKEITFNVPFEIGITMSETEYQEYGPMLQKIMEDVLADSTAD